MTSKVSFRFRNAVSTEDVLFDGSVIQIRDVKRLIAVKRGLGEEGAAELTLFDPNTNEEYTDDGKVIPRNSLVIVKRTPVTRFQPLQSTAPAAAAPAAAAPAQPAADQRSDAAAAALQPAADEFGGDYYTEQPQRAVVGEDEGKALANLLQGTAATWQREVRQGAMRGRGRGRGGRGLPTLDYRCSRCGISALPAHDSCGCFQVPKYAVAVAAGPYGSFCSAPAFASPLPLLILAQTPDPLLSWPFAAGVMPWASTGSRTAPHRATPTSTASASGRPWASQ